MNKNLETPPRAATICVTQKRFVKNREFKREKGKEDVFSSLSSKEKTEKSSSLF